VLPEDSPDAVERELRRVIDDEKVALERVLEPVAGPASPLRPDVMRALEGAVAEHFPGAVIVPAMSTGASDGVYLRGAGIPVYGTGAIFEREGEDRSHGRDERVGVQAFYEAAEFWRDLVMAVAGR
jgi:acetylornithine deacetylase/succinyl-diaminopimelate desuccinylase-like protein